MIVKRLTAVLISSLGLIVILFHGSKAIGAETPTTLALTGLVNSSEEGPMEGVLISAKKVGSTITITVATNHQGRFVFPRQKLVPGEYSLRIRAVGYEMEKQAIVQVAPQKVTRVDLKLHRTADLASQLTNAEWLLSIPGSDEQKDFLLECVNCHTLERIVKSHHTPDEWVSLFHRMAGYASGSSPEHPQKRVDVNPNRFGNEEKLREQAEYMSTINLSKVNQWTFPLMTLPRPKGRATKMVVTEYDLPRPEAMPHDAIVDSKGMVWYTDFGEQYLGELDPKTGKVIEYQVPVLKQGFPLGELQLDQDKAGYLWLGMMSQGGIARFDPKTHEFMTWSLPKEVTTDATQVSMVAPFYDDIDGKVWTCDGGTQLLHRLSSGRYETFDPFKNFRTPDGKSPGHSIYGVVSDSKNNAYFMDIANTNIGRIDAKTTRVQLYPTPTSNSHPRRGQMDSEDRLYFGEYWANKIGMFDTRNQQFQEWAAPSPWDLPYDAVRDKNGDVWSSGMTSDRVLRLDMKTGKFTEYLLPQHTQIRRVFVDNSTYPVTFWVGNNHGASIVKVEPLN